MASSYAESVTATRRLQSSKIHSTFSSKRRKVVTPMGQTQSIPVATMADRKYSKRVPNGTGFKRLSWPAKAVPVEVFNQIAAHLPRSSVENMRLVNHEFEEKVSEILFRTVVVPFRPEIYGITDQSNGEYEEANVGFTLPLQDHGMKVFQGFGPHIRRFAMSFEIDYSMLCTPPSKSTQEAITTFWGIYCWPLLRYNRYTQLEDLEQTADETRAMTKAFKYLSKATELGLSMDAGLGWLQGPDLNSWDKNPYRKPSVFGSSRFTEDKTGVNSSLPKKAYLTSDPITSSSINSKKYPMFHTLLSEAGYKGADLEASLRTLLESHGLPYSTHESQAASSDSDGSTSSSEYTVASEMLRIAPVRHIRHARYSRSIIEDDYCGGHDRLKEAIDLYPLKGNNITLAQMEMLLEVEWAQRAFMQSYAIAVIDNQAVFGNITKFTISRLSSKHLNVLKRTDFWLSLPKLQELSLAVIPEWREISKLPTGSVLDVPIVPSGAIPGVFRLLQDQVAHHPSIKRLHFEWLCGGEEAMGMFARNQLILPAPLVAQAADMITSGGLSSNTAILSLPNVRYLSLKNCWASPHIFARFVKILEDQQLEVLSLKSVLLCAHCPPGTVPRSPNEQHANNQNAQMPGFMQFQLQHGGPMGQAAPPVVGQAAPPPFVGHALPMMANNIPPPAVPAPTDAPNPQTWLDEPFRGSWPSIIDIVTPGISLADHRYSHNRGDKPAPRQYTTLKEIVFDSCGYVKLPLDFDQRRLVTGRTQFPWDRMTSKRYRDLGEHMMKTSDLFIGSIIEHMSDLESLTLRLAWGLHEGLSPTSPNQANLFKADGFQYTGRGRFYGTIKSPKKLVIASL